MYSDSILISNNSLKDGLPKLDMSELPPLPAFQAKTSSVAQSQGDTPVQPQNNSLILVSLIVLAVLFVVLIRIYLKLRKQDIMESESFSMSKLFEKPKKQIKKIITHKKDNIESKQEIQQEKIENTNENLIEKEETEVENSPIYSFKLGTPKSLSRCIKIFLEITLEK